MVDDVNTVEIMYMSAWVALVYLLICHSVKVQNYGCGMMNFIILLLWYYCCICAVPGAHCSSWAECFFCI